VKRTIAASLLMACITSAASAQTPDARPEQTRQSRKTNSNAKEKDAAQQSAKADEAMAADAPQTSSAMATSKTACAATDTAEQPNEQSNGQAKKTEGDPAASQNVVEYGGGGF